MSTSYPGRVGAHVALVLALAIVASMSGARGHLHGAQAPARPSLETRARAVLAQHSGTIVVNGLKAPVEVLRDTWGIPHIYAQSTEDLFFAQGFVVAQDRMWQLELWRRNGEGRLAEVLGPEYVTRDTFARLLAFRGNWDEEFKKYHPQGRAIFDGFAAGVNAAIQKALDEDRIPVEFDIMGFKPLPVWTAQTVLTRMPGWTLSRNAASEVQRALDIKAMGARKVEELKPTEPKKALQVPAGLDLDDIEPAILDVTRDANNLRWTLGARSPARASSGGAADAASDFASTSSGDEGAPSAGTMASARRLAESIGLSPNPWLDEPDLGSNNWVVSGSKSTTGGPIIANDPHREVVNPALRYVVHLVAPGWNALGATEPGLPGISIGHNERLAWAFTILGVDQQDLYVEETDPANPHRYRVPGGEWREMALEHHLIGVKGESAPRQVELAFTRHGPVLYANRTKHRAFALKWVGAEPGGAGYLGSLNVMQTTNWQTFNEALPRAWYIPSHSLVYADVDGHIGYMGVAQTPVRRNWDGLLPVPGKDGAYEWEGYIPFDKLPKSLDAPRGFYNSSNNDVVPKVVPGYTLPLGYEYSAPFRYNRVAEVLSSKKAFSVADMQALQRDTVSLPARQVVPLLRRLTLTSPEARAAAARLLTWNYDVGRDSVEATIYEFLMLKLGPLAYAPMQPGAAVPTSAPSPTASAPAPGPAASFAAAAVRQYDIGRVLEWMVDPPAAYARPGLGARAARDLILADALEQAVAELAKRYGADQTKWLWGDIHTTDFVHPLATTPDAQQIFGIVPVRRGGDSYTVMAATSPSETSTKQTSGASFMYVFDVKDWDNSTGLSAPGNSAQPLSPHYQDLVPAWADGTHVPLVYSRARVEAVTTDRLVLQPLRDGTLDAPGTKATPARSMDDLDLAVPRFEPVQPELFAIAGAESSAWADFDNDGDLDLFVGFRGQMNRLYRNDAGHFVDVAAAVGVADAEETRVAAWGDYDGDGHVDLYVGFAPGARTHNKLYRNDGDGRHFTDVAVGLGVDGAGTSRQAAFVDYDNDGDLDLFVAYRDSPNTLFRNDGGRFTDVTASSGIGDPRRTVGVVWFDMDQDGDLDAFVANQNGDNDGFYRNDGGHFVDVAKTLHMDGGRRPAPYGGVGPSVADYDNDGDLDLYVANYGPNFLYRNDGGGRFTEVAAELGIAGDYHATTSNWGDYDNDGRPDLYVATYLTGIMYVRDYLYRNEGKSFRDVIPPIVLKHDASHGVQWADFDQDGDLDLALADNGPTGQHFLFRNLLPPERAHRAVNVMVLDAAGRATRAGSEVRVYAAGTRTLYGTGLVDTGSGYCSQNVMPVHVGLPAAGRVDVEVTALTPRGRDVTRVADVDPSELAGKPLVVKVGSVGRTTQSPP
ncbi:MAG: penicillin acylase family protein [Vicinamibacterales bacterium]